MADQYACERRGAILDMRKEEFAASLLRGDPRGHPHNVFSKAATAFRLAFQAKPVGVNLAAPDNRRSVDAQYVALRRRLPGGFSADLDRAGLLKVFASKHLEEQWTDELFELNRDAYGKPGITKNVPLATSRESFAVTPCCSHKSFWPTVMRSSVFHDHAD